MALATACASCAVSAVSEIVLTYPTPIAHYVNYITTTHLNIVDGSTTTSFATGTVSSPGDSALPSGSPTGLILSVTGHPTWEVSGTVLTWPNTYIQYQGFVGAAATASDQCAETLAATPLNLPGNVNQASLIYPSAGGALPGALLGYLDSLGLQSQLGGDQLVGCGMNRQIQGPLASTPFGNTTNSPSSAPATPSTTPSTTPSPMPLTTPSTIPSTAPSTGSSSSTPLAPMTTTSSASSTSSLTAPSTSAISSNSSSVSSAPSSSASSSNPGETFTLTTTSLSTGTTVLTTSIPNTTPTVVTTVTPPLTTTSPPFLPTTTTATYVSAVTGVSVAIFTTLKGPTVITNMSSTVTQTAQPDMMTSSATTSYEGLASILESILSQGAAAASSTGASPSASPLISGITLPGTVSALSAATTSAGIPIYTNSNGSAYTLATVTGSGTVNSTNATMTGPTIVPYTGAASKDLPMPSVQWLGGLLGFLVPFFL